MELIDKDALIKELGIDRECECCQYVVGDYLCGCDISQADICEAIAEAPTIEVPKWIPCSERLPTEEEQDIDLGVLVTLGNGYKGMDFDWYHNGHWYDWGDRVIAWMPLSKPYEESEK